MRPTAKWFMALLTLFLALAGAPPVHAQAGRFIPFRRIPLPRAPIPRLPPGGGGSRISPHIPVHIGGNENGHRDDDNTVGWIILAILGTLVLVFGGWFLGRAIGGWLRPIPKIPKSSWFPEHTDWQPDNIPSMQDLILKPSDVAAKNEQTRSLMAFLAHADPAFDPDDLQSWIAMTFPRVQKAWEVRDYSSVRHLLLPDILAKHEELLESMREHHEINHIEDLRIERLEFVHLHCPQSAEEPELTALITFIASMYFVDDQKGAYTRGLRSPSLFQEFWIFRRREGCWMLQDIEQSRLSNRLERPNVVADLAASN